MLALLLALALPAAAAPLSIEWSVSSGPWSSARALSPLAGAQVRLRVKAGPGAKVRWYQLIPDLDTMYKNANFPWERDAYKWAGFAKMRVDREELRRFRDRPEIELFAARRRAKLGDWTEYESPLPRSAFYHPDAGSFWFQAEVEEGRVTRRSPGLESSDHRGLSPSVLRVSVREVPGYLGWVTSYFNVPALFGSVPWQTDHYLGADCADTLVGAHGHWSGALSSVNYNVDRLVAELPAVAEVDSGSPDTVRWGETVRAGDLVAVRYPGARRYQHVGVLVSDDGNGVLDDGDAVLHAGPLPLQLDRLGSGPFGGHLKVLRWKAPAVVDKPVRFGPERERLTREYIKERYGAGGEGVSLSPRVLVLHWTGSSDLEASFSFMDPETLPEARADIAAGGRLNVSAHFLVGRDGTVYRLMPETRMARHTIGLNLSAIGVENVGGKDGDDLTPAQARANAWLARELKDRYPALEYLIGHHEYLRFEGHPLWLERSAAYRTRKSDPGERFMGEVRRLAAPAGLKGPP